MLLFLLHSILWLLELLLLLILLVFVRDIFGGRGLNRVELLLIALNIVDLLSTQITTHVNSP